MALREEQMLLLEQITYFDKTNCFDYMGIDPAPQKSELLDWILNPTDSQNNPLSTEELMSLIDKIPNKQGDTEIDGSEWKSIISAIRSDSDFQSLKCVEYNANTKAFCFANETDNTATFVFQGTASRWKDNFDGLYEVDTKDQIAAREFVETTGARFDSVDIVGHSKGGNLAQYATITADYSKVNINKCISMDGQGFSKEFLDTYSDQIMAHGSSIKNYCYKNDFVNILINKVPGEEQIYCEGSDIGADNHFSNSMFELINTGTEDEPCWNVVWRKTEQNAGMEYLHGFTCYVANNMPLEERKKMGNFIGELVDYIFNSKDSSDVKSKFLTKKIKEHPEYAAKLLAYFIKYADDNNLSDDQIYQLLQAFGLEKERFAGKSIVFWVKTIKKFIVDHPNITFFTLGLLKDFLKAAGIVDKKDTDEIWNYIKMVYNEYKDIEHKKYVNGDYVPEKIAVANVTNIVVDSVNNTISTIGGMSGKIIKVNTELLRNQSDELFSFYKQFEDLTSEIKACIERSDKACSRNMSMYMMKKTQLIIADLEKMNVLLDSGARAAYNAATSYESIDQALAKQISIT